MIELTLKLDYSSEEELFHSYLWDKFLSNAITCNKCESFRVTTAEPCSCITVLQLLNLFPLPLDEEPNIICFEDGGTGSNYRFLFSNSCASKWPPDILCRAINRMEVRNSEDPPCTGPVVVLFLAPN